MSVVHAVHDEHPPTECISDWGRSDGKVNGQVYQQIHEPRPALIPALLLIPSIFAACKVVVFESASGNCKQTVESRAVQLQHHIAYLLFCTTAKHVIFLMLGTSYFLVGGTKHSSLHAICLFLSHVYRVVVC